jgi:hypothetical protein
MKNQDIKIALENYFYNLKEQGFGDVPTNKHLNNIVYKLKKVFNNAVYIDQHWLMYDKDMVLIEERNLFKSAGSFVGYFKQGFANEVLDFIDNLIEVRT